MAAMSEDTFRRALAAFQAGQLSDAERLFKAALQSHPDNVAALNLLCVLLMQIERFAEAEGYIRRALQLNATSDVSFYNYGVILQALRRPAEALACFDKALAINPKVAQTRNNRGVVLNDLKRYAEAIAEFETATALQPNYPEASFNKAKSLAALRRYDEAINAYDQGLALQPDVAEAWVGRGNVCNALYRHADAFAAYNRALVLKPDLADAWVGLGNAHKDLAHYDEAASSYDKALRFQPDLADAWLGHGNVHRERQEYEYALKAYAKALASQPDLAEAWLGRGNVFKDLRRYDEAIGAYDKAIELKPDLAEAWLGRGAVFSELQNHEKAYSAFDRAYTLNPNLPGVEGARLHAKLYLCDWSGFHAEREHLIASLRKGNANILPFSLLAISASAADQLQCAKLWIDKKCPRLEMPAWPAEQRERKIIRVAYLSPDFRRHPVGEGIVGVLEQHDRSRFETIGLSIGSDDGSAARARIVKALDRFYDLNTKTDLEAAAFARELGVDIVVALALHTEATRPGILALRPAPIQVSASSAWTTGAEFIDYVLADPHALPFNEQAHFPERIVHLPDSFFPYDSTPEISSHTPSRAEAGLPEDAFVFCCFNRNYKLNPQMFDVWMRILKSVDGSVLWLMQNNNLAIHNLRREAEIRGVNPARLVFAPTAPLLKDHFARHRLADLFLDTIPFNAHTTAIDALYAGLPVLSVRGGAFVGRVAESQLRAVGLVDMVATTLEDYEAAAVRFARNPKELKALRDRLAANRLTYPLFNSQRLCRHIEAAYLEMMERHRRGEPPAPFAVKPID